MQNSECIAAVGIYLTSLELRLLLETVKCVLACMTLARSNRMLTQACVDFVQLRMPKITVALVFVSFV